MKSRENEALLEFLIENPEYVEQYPDRVEFYIQSTPKTNNNYPLHNSVKLGRDERVKELLTVNHMDSNIQDDMGFTALMYAVRKGFNHIATMLLEAKAHLEVENKNHEKAFDLAMKPKFRLSIINLLFSYGAKVSDPLLLFNQLQLQDQRNPDVLSALEILYQQLKESNINPNVLREISVYLEKLKLLNQIYQNKIANIIDVSTQNQLPKDLVGVMSKYDSLTDRVRFFKSDEIDTMLSEVVKEKKFSFSK